MYGIMVCVYVCLYSVSCRRLKRNGACYAKHWFIVQNICSFFLSELDWFIVQKTDVSGMQTTPLCKTTVDYLSRRVHCAKDVFILSDDLLIVQQTYVSGMKTSPSCKKTAHYLSRRIHCAQTNCVLYEDLSIVPTTCVWSTKRYPLCKCVYACLYSVSCRIASLS